jgi:hypothetical protein
VVFIAINGLVGLQLAPFGWMATLPVMGYVVGGALSTRWWRRAQRAGGGRCRSRSGWPWRWCRRCVPGRRSAGSFWLLCTATVVAGYYSANGQLYRFAAAELAAPAYREKAVSLVLAGGLLGAVAGPNLASATRTLPTCRLPGAYMALAGGAAVHGCAWQRSVLRRRPWCSPAAGSAEQGRPLVRDDAPAGVHRGHCWAPRWAMA